MFLEPMLLPKYWPAGLWLLPSLLGGRASKSLQNFHKHFKSVMPWCPEGGKIMQNLHRNLIPKGPLRNWKGVAWRQLFHAIPRVFISFCPGIRVSSDKILCYLIIHGTPIFQRLRCHKVWVSTNRSLLHTPISFYTYTCNYNGPISASYLTWF